MHERRDVKVATSATMVFDEQTAGKGVVILFFNSLPPKITKYPHVISLQTERVKEIYQKTIR